MLCFDVHDLELYAFIKLPCSTISRSGALAKEWCYNTTCPTNPKDATKSNCCIYHVNVHSCPLEDTIGGLCGPWISPSGSTFTHSAVLGVSFICHISRPSDKTA